MPHILDWLAQCCLACGAHAADIVDGKAPARCEGELQYREYIRSGHFFREIRPAWK